MLARMPRGLAMGCICVSLWSVACPAQGPEPGTPARRSIAPPASATARLPADEFGWLDWDRIDALRMPTLGFAGGELRGSAPRGLAGAGDRPSLWQRILGDHREFYSPRSLTGLAGGLGVGAIMANTNVDETIHRRYQQGLRHASSDETFEFLHSSKELGNGIYTLPLFAGAWMAGEMSPDTYGFDAAGRWGERSLRGFLIGAPALVILQPVLGGSRPDETDHKSHWRPFADNNAVSGHSFMSSLPFLTAARMAENRWAKSALYAGSALGPLSRLNDDAHYASQIMLGWWLAFLATDAVFRSDQSFGDHWSVTPMATPSGAGMMAEFRW